MPGEMRIAFVGIEKDWEALAARPFVDPTFPRLEQTYVQGFIKYHLEIPWYYSQFGRNRVVIFSDVPKHDLVQTFGGRCSSAYIAVDKNENFGKGEYKKYPFDVIIHWRKWCPDFYDSRAVNVMLSQDHTYSPQWVNSVTRAANEGKLYGILCFPTWHVENMRREVPNAKGLRFLTGVTLGVDPDVYTPAAQKDRYSLLWASDPGRGMMGAVDLALRLFQKDKRFKLNVCWPDYIKSRQTMVVHPGVKYHQNLQNGPALWDLFNTAGFLPYTSCFMEPSSRVHRQAMSAGCVVLYPPNRGTPSELLTDGIDGIVRPMEEWAETILNLVNDDAAYERLSKAAREHAVRESWEVQAQRFNSMFQEILNDR